MWLSSDTSRLEKQQKMLSGSSEYLRRSRVVAAQEVGSASVILDALGKILYCNAAARDLFRANAQQLLGQDIRTLMPDLPIRPITPGYNLAYATFWAAEGEWRRFSGRDSRGCLFRLLAALDRTELESRRHILLSLRPARAPAHLPRPFASGSMPAGREAACIALCDHLSRPHRFPRHFARKSALVMM